jgi:hypothetical protein
MSTTPTSEKACIEVAWKREALERCRAYDEGKLTERDAVDVLNGAYRKGKSKTKAENRNARAGRPCH